MTSAVGSQAFPNTTHSVTLRLSPFCLTDPKLENYVVAALTIISSGEKLSLTEAGDSRHWVLTLWRCGESRMKIQDRGRVESKQESITDNEKQAFFFFFFTSDPVNGDALHPADAGGDDVLPPRLVPLGPGDPVQAHVSPVDGVVGCGDA